VTDEGFGMMMRSWDACFASYSGDLCSSPWEPALRRVMLVSLTRHLRLKGKVSPGTDGRVVTGHRLCILLPMPQLSEQRRISGGRYSFGCSRSPYGQVILLKLP
jgi:hypothetical protein